MFLDKDSKSLPFSLFFAVIGLSAVAVSNDHISFATLVFIVVTALIFGLTVWFMVSMKQYCRRRNLFRELIGMNDNEGWNDEEKSLVQPLVDQALSVLSQNAADAFGKENEMRDRRKELPLPGINPSPQIVETCLEARRVTDAAIAELHKQSEIAKEKFWQAHKAFSELGFTVKEKIGDYR
ncbi:MAG: hypothetical protein V1885_01630 [Candidatus Brennerbacteria bacterium]